MAEMALRLADLAAFMSETNLHLPRKIATLEAESSMAFSRLYSFLREHEVA